MQTKYPLVSLVLLGVIAASPVFAQSQSIPQEITTPDKVHWSHGVQRGRWKPTPWVGRRFSGVCEG